MVSLAIDNFNVPNHPSGETTAAIIRDRPEDAHGVLIGYGTKRFVVELLTSSGAIWGPTGTTVWGPTGDAVYGGSKSWLDITADVTGFAIGQRGSGSTLAERPNPGTFTLTLANPDDTYSTWNTETQPFVGPGAIIRVGINDPAETIAFIGWQPLILGVVETLSDESTEVDAYRYVTVTLVEPHSDLAKIDGYEQAPVGTGEPLVDRLARLLDEAGYRFGTTTSDIVYNTAGVMWSSVLQSTNLAQNRLTEIYLTVDSTDTQFISAKTGQPMLVPLPDPGDYTRTSFYTASNLFGYAYPVVGETSTTLVGSDLGLATIPSDPFAVMPWVAVDTAADNEAIVNKVALARAGGTVQVASTAAPRTGPATFARSDLVLADDSDVQTLATRLLGRGITANQYATVEVNIAHDDRMVDWLAQLDLYQKVDILRDFSSGRHPEAAAKDLVGVVIGYSMAITPRAPVADASVLITWTATVNLQVIQVNDYTP